MNNITYNNLHFTFVTIVTIAIDEIHKKILNFPML